MPTLFSLFAPARRALAGHLAQLGGTLGALAAEVREAVARAVSRSAADAVREAVQAALDGADAGRRPLPPPPHGPRYPSPSWHESGPPWSRDAEDASDRDDPYWRDDDDGRPRYVTPDDPDGEDTPRAGPRPGAWGRAVAAGCQAAAWWLRGRPGPLSLPAALAVGLAAGLAALVSEPLAAAALALAGLALTVLGLRHAARSGAALADPDND
jgi:type II secretory pathway pseudopilin PulG